jgi:hypothetical protein
MSLNWTIRTKMNLASGLLLSLIVTERSDLKYVELRVELCAGGLLLAVHSGPPYLVVTPVDHDGEAGSGLEVVQELAQHWGMRRQTDGSRVVWCIIRPPTSRTRSRPPAASPASASAPARRMPPWLPLASP